MTTQNARSLVGRAVVSIADGEKLGTISDVQFDLKRHAVLGFLIGGGLFNREKASFLPLAHVHSLGPHAVTITDKQAVTDTTDDAAASTLSDLKKPVLTASGEVIGDGDDLLFDDTSGTITALQLAPQGGFLGIGATTHVIPLNDVIDIGPDAITVQDAVLARVRGE